MDGRNKMDQMPLERAKKLREMLWDGSPDEREAVRRFASEDPVAFFEARLRPPKPRGALVVSAEGDMIAMDVVQHLRRLCWEVVQVGSLF